MMTPREIVARAWTITTKERPLRRWGLASATLETLLNTKLLIYQLWFFTSYYRGDPIGFFTVEAVLLEHVPFWFFLTFVITFVVLVLIELIFPHFAIGAIIGLGAKAHRQEEMRGGLVLAIYNFFPVFVVHELLVLSKLTTTVTIISLILRYGELKGFAVGIVIAVFIISNILKFLTSFAEESIVIRKVGPFAGMGRSIKLVLSYLGHVMFLILLLLVISLRILLNIAMALLIPGVVVGLGFLFTLFLSKAVSIVLATGIGFLLVLGASYLSSYLLVFKQTVWTITYLELSARKDVDVIEEEGKTST